MAGLVEDERPDQEAYFAETEELDKRQGLMRDAMQGLNPGKCALSKPAALPNRHSRWKSWLSNLALAVSASAKLKSAHLRNSHKRYCQSRRDEITACHRSLNDFTINPITGEHPPYLLNGSSPYRIITFRAGGQQRDRNPSQLFHTADIFQRIGRQIGPCARTISAFLPARHFFIDRCTGRLVSGI